MKRRDLLRKKHANKRQTTSVRKISETLIDFAQPIIEIIDEDTTEEQIKMGFVLVVTVWNSLVFEVVKNDPSYVETLWEAISEMEVEDGAAIVEALIARKRKKFKDDLRAIADHSISYSCGHLNVKAEARLITGKGIN
jgi:hypothetical protein